jgi:thiamine-monophosphate kinase
MAARPIGVLASLSVPPADAGPFATALMRGVREAAEAVGGVVLGGDLTRSPGGVVLDVVVVGETAAPVLRSGAKPGDALWVTGRLGGAAAFVAARLADRRPPRGVRGCFACPVPRVREAMWLAARGIPTAMLDLSDGLAGDAAHLAAASRVAIDLEPGRVPAHPGASAEDALRGGEDYELCFAARDLPERLRTELERELGTTLTRVGRVRRGHGVWIVDGNGRRPAGATQFQHFREG